MTSQDELETKDRWTKITQQKLDEILVSFEKFVKSFRDSERTLGKGRRQHA